MASDFFKPFLAAAMTGGATIDLLTVNVQLVLVDAADYTVDLDAHDFLADIPAGARIATSGNFTNKTWLLFLFCSAREHGITMPNDHSFFCMAGMLLIEGTNYKLLALIIESV